MIVPKPALNGTLRPDWEWKETITFLHPSGQGNVMFSSEPVETKIDTAAYARIQGEILSAQFAGYEEQVSGARPVLGEEDGYVRRFTWAPSDGPTVAQTQIYFVEGGRAYTATATVTLARIELEPDLLQTLNDLRIRR